MIEIPEASTIVRQMNVELKGKVVAAGNRGNSPHKFAFYSQRSLEEYASIMKDKTVGEATVNGPLVLAQLEPDHTLMLRATPGSTHAGFQPKKTGRARSNKRACFPSILH